MAIHFFPKRVEEMDPKCPTCKVGCKEQKLRSGEMQKAPLIKSTSREHRHYKETIQSPINQRKTEARFWSIATNGETLWSQVTFLLLSSHAFVHDFVTRFGN